jgi:hypothetical protein
MVDFLMTGNFFTLTELFYYKTPMWRRCFPMPGEHMIEPVPGNANPGRDVVAGRAFPFAALNIIREKSIT